MMLLSRNPRLRIDSDREMPGALTCCGAALLALVAATCSSGVYRDPDSCTPDCGGRVCGDDGCDGSCGTCSAAETCEAGICVACVPQCDGAQCGSDGCGGGCGTCVAGDEFCNGSRQCVPTTSGAGVLSGELKTWHKITVTYDGPELSETGNPNPFTDYRLDVTFEKDGVSYVVPGYYAADGDAANTSATSGNKWRVHFVPDSVGRWAFSVSFRVGANVAASTDINAGASAEYFDGDGGTLEVAPTDKDPEGVDLRGKGMAQYVGGHYLQFQETGEYLLKGGPGDPENFLAYGDFDGGGRHTYSAHTGQWRDGDPTWKNAKGKGIIGAINYLSSVGMNSVYLLSMNVTGDGDDVWPWVNKNDMSSFDTSKLDQWGIVFDHFTAKGVNIHMIHSEKENYNLINGGDLGVERKIFYRELVARFSHALSLVWNLGEETERTATQHKNDSTYINAVDPYHHPIVVHTPGGSRAAERTYGPLLGYPDFYGVSLQKRYPADVHENLLHWRSESSKAGRPWIIASDEVNQAPLKKGAENAAQRHHMLYGSLMGGGYGAEYFFGMSSLREAGDFSDYARVWEWTRHGLTFFREYLPFWEMEPSDGLVSTGWCLAKRGEVYAIYLPNGGSTNLDLSGESGDFEVKWHNPRDGGALLTGSTTSVSGGRSRSLGYPPNSASSDWLLLVRR